MAEPSPQTSMLMRGARRQVPESTDSGAQRRRRNVDRFPLPISSIPVGQSPPPSWLGDPQTSKAETTKASPKTSKGPGRKRKGDLSPIPEEIQKGDEAVVLIPPSQRPRKKRKTRKARQKPDERSFTPQPELSEDDEELELLTVANRTRSGRKRKKMSQSDRAFVPTLDDDADDDLTLPPTPALSKKKHGGKSTSKRLDEIPEPASTRKGKSKSKAESKKAKAADAHCITISDDDDDDDQIDSLDSLSPMSSESEEEVEKEEWELRTTGHDRPLNRLWLRREAAGESLAHIVKYLDEEEVWIYDRNNIKWRLNPRWLQWEAAGKPPGFRRIPKYYEQEVALEDAKIISPAGIDWWYSGDETDEDEDEGAPRFLGPFGDRWDSDRSSSSSESSEDPEYNSNYFAEDKGDVDDDESAEKDKHASPSSPEEEEGKVWELRRYGPDRPINPQWRKWKLDGKPFMMIGPIPKFLDEHILKDFDEKTGQEGRRYNPRWLTWEAAGKPSGYKPIPKWLDDEEPAVKAEVDAYEKKRFGNRYEILCNDPNDPENKTTSESSGPSENAVDDEGDKEKDVEIDVDENEGGDDGRDTAPTTDRKRKVAQMEGYYADEIAAAHQLHAPTPSASPPSKAAPTATPSPAKRRKKDSPSPSTPTRGSNAKKQTSKPTPSRTKRTTAKAKTATTPKAKTQSKAKATKQKQKQAVSKRSKASAKETAASKAETQKTAAERKAKFTRPAPPPAPTGTRRSARLKDMKG